MRDFYRTVRVHQSEKHPELIGRIGRTVYPLNAQGVRYGYFVFFPELNKGFSLDLGDIIDAE